MVDHYPACERYTSGESLPCICELLSEHADRMVETARAETYYLKAHLATLKRLNGADTAEINRLKETVALRAEVAALRKQMDALLRDEAKWGYNIRREALAGLRAKVEGLGLCIERDDGDECLCTPVEFNAARVTLDKVLALIDGGENHG